MLNYYFHQKLLFIFAIVIATIPFYYLKPFQDSLIYWEQAKLVWNNGFIITISEIYSQTNKIEPFILIIFYIEGLLGLTDSGAFLFSNTLACNILVVISAIRLANSNNSRLNFYLILLILVSYPIFSNTLYIWRTIFAICFFILSITNEKFKYKTIFFIFSISSHQSIILFYFIYIILSKLSKLSKLNTLFYSSVIGFSLYFLINKFTFLSYFISADISVFLKAGQDTIIRIFINIYCILILLFISSRSRIHHNLVIFSIFLLVISLFLNFNWQMMSRISAPALILTPLLALSTNPGKQKQFIIYVLLFAGLIPTFRIIYLIIFDTYPN